ncbi:hypothetical protein DU153_03485 [Salmonella enterica subsp. enterica]|nr:hypothetical protein [Salmonella enterica subsp. enterica]
MKNMNTRTQWIDALKAIAIFWIYLGHFGDNGKQLYQFAFSFHVPLFFFISGVFYKKCQSLHELASIIKNGFIKLIVPYFVFSILSLIFFSLYNNSSFDQVKEMMLQILPAIRNQIFAASLWFLPCLFVMIVIYSLILLTIKNKHVIFIVCLIIFIISTKLQLGFVPAFFFNIDSALLYIVYYALGAYTSGFIRDTVLISENKYRNAALFLLVSISMVVFVYSYFFGSGSIYNNIHSETMRIILSFVITVLLFIPNIMLSKFITLPPILEIGRSTLVLCGTEQLIKTLIYSTFNMLGMPIYLHNPVDTIVYTIICLLISYFTTIKAYKYLYGKKQAL